MTKTEFAQSTIQTFKNIPNDFLLKIEKYKNFLRAYNQNVNLTRLDDEDKIYGEYFYESIIPYKDFDFTKVKSLLDIGSGSGIPGIVLKLLYPHLNLTIIESNNKKCLFLKSLSKELEVDVNVLNQRAESIQSNQREQFDLVTSRAVAPLPFILELSLPYVKVSGFLIEPKSKKGLVELSNIEPTIEKLGGKLFAVNQFESVNHKSHVIIMVQKSNKTSHQYPRQ
jgi:16S rRNA (guanine527-N7)-methyltransferase